MEQEVLSFAAEELQRYCRLMDAQGVPEIALSVEAAVCPADGDPALDDAYRIAVENGRGAIEGSNARSVLLGVYAFLRAAGCRFLRPGAEGESIPKRPLREVSVHLSETASHRYRGFCIEGAVSRENVRDMIDWMPKLGFNLYFIQFREAHIFFEEWYTHVFNEFLPAEPYTVEDSRRIVRGLGEEIRRRGLHYHAVGHGWTCESVGYASTGWHSADNAAIPDTVRPLLAQVNGKREFFGGIPINTQLCYSNPEVRERMAQEIARYAEENPGKEVLHIWLADNFNNSCECENCQKARPADFYIRMLNRADELLTQRGLPTRLAFIVAYDLLWTPLRERFRNPSRFLMMFAPITRTYRRPYHEPGEPDCLPKPYTRNRLQLPESAAENLVYLREWQRLFPGDCFVFDYHMMWDLHKDHAQLALSRVLFRDLELLRELGLNGYIGCQLTRSFFPSGFCNYLMGRKLFDRTLSYEALQKEYFEAAYGEHWQDAWKFLSEISEGLSWAYDRGELSIHDRAAAERFRETPERLYAYQPLLSLRREQASEACVKKQWEFLLEASEIYAELALVLYHKAEGLPTEQVLTQFELFRANLCRREARLQSVFDLCSFILIVQTIVRKEENEAIAFDEKA